MFGKLYASLFNGTLRGKAHQILVFANMIATCDRKGWVDKHPQAIAEETGLTLEEVIAACKYLEAPDPESRSKECGGARIERIDEHRSWGWRVVNYVKYRRFRDGEARQEQNRKAQQAYRERKKSLHNTVSQISATLSQVQPDSAKLSHDQPKSAHAEAEAEAEASTIPSYEGTETAVSVPLHKQGDSEPVKKTKIKKPSTVVPPKDEQGKAPSERTVFITLWCQRFKEQFGVDYVFSGARDGKASGELVDYGTRYGMPTVDLVEQAVEAWKAPGFLGEKSKTMHGFRAHLNEILTRPSAPSKPGNKLSPSMQAVLAKQELERVEKSINSIKTSYDGHQTMSPEDRERLAKLRLRQTELKTSLGFIV